MMARWVEDDAGTVGDGARGCLTVALIGVGGERRADPRTAGDGGVGSGAKRQGVRVGSLADRVGGAAKED
jgi:hypothetical protein